MQEEPTNVKGLLSKSLSLRETCEIVCKYKLNAKLLANLVLAFPPLQLSRKLLLYFVSNTINKESNEADSHDNAMLRLKNKINLLHKSCTDNWLVIAASYPVIEFFERFLQANWTDEVN